MPISRREINWNKLKIILQTIEFKYPPGSPLNCFRKNGKFVSADVAVAEVIHTVGFTIEEGLKAETSYNNTEPKH